MKRSDCFQWLWSCYHAAAPDWNKWPQGDWEGMGITELRKGLLTSDKLFHTLFTFSLGCVKDQVTAALANGMGVISSSKVHASWLRTGQRDTCFHRDPADSGGAMLNFTSVLWRTPNSEITEGQLADYCSSFQTGRKLGEEKALATLCSFCGICHSFQQHELSLGKHKVMNELLVLAKRWA